MGVALGAGPPRAVSLQDAARSTADPRPAQPTPCPPPLQHAVADMAQMPPPSLPFTQHTNSRIYVPLLLHAAGMVSPETRASWFADASIGDWWRRQVEAVSARPFLPVHDTVAAIAFVAQARGDDLRQSAPFQRLVAWAALRPSGAESLSTMLHAVAVPEEGHYFPAAIQEGLLTFLLGQHGASILERDIAALRQPNALFRAASPPPPFMPPAPSTPAPQARGEAPSPQVVPAAPAPHRVRPRVCLTGAPDTTQGDHDDAPPRTDNVPAAETSQGGAGHSALAGIPAAAWSSLDAVDLAADVGTPVPTMCSCALACDKPLSSLYSLSAKHTRAARPLSKPELGNCSCSRRACCSTAPANRARSAGKPSCNVHVTSLLDAGTLCSAPPAQPLPHHVLAPQPTSLMLPMPKPSASGGEHSRAPMCGVEKFLALALP